MKRVIALGLAAVVLTGATSTPAFASDDVGEVAKTAADGVTQSAADIIATGTRKASTPARRDFDELMFIVTVQKHTKVIGLAPERGILSLGNTACRTLKTGTSVSKLAQSMIGVGVPARDAGVVIGAAAANLCPSQLAGVLRYLRNHS